MAHLRNKGHGLDERSIARSPKAKQSVTVHLADKERTVYGPVDVVLKVDFVEIRTVEWVTLDKDLSGQIHLGKNELALRVVGQSKVPAEANFEADAVMTIQVGFDDGQFYDDGHARHWCWIQCYASKCMEEDRESNLNSVDHCN